MIRVLAVGFGPYPGAPASPGLEIVQTLAAERWRPDGAELAVVGAPTQWWAGPSAALAALFESRADAVVLFGCARGVQRLMVAQAARNWAARTPDEAGQCWPGRELSPGGAAALSSTLDAAALACAIDAAGAPAEVVADGGDYVWNRAFYAILSETAPPPAALVLAPAALESARRLGLAGPAALNRATILAGAQAALRHAASAARRRTAAA